MKTFLNGAGVALLAANISLFAAPSKADIVNPWFEDSMQPSQVPVGWSANAAYLSEPDFNQVNKVHSFSVFALQIGNDEDESVPILSQSFTDAPGEIYSLSFEAAAGDRFSDPKAFLTVSVNTTQVTLGQINIAYSLHSLEFVGTGTDTISISALNQNTFYYVDQIELLPIGFAGSVPEPSTWAMMILGFLGIGTIAYRRRNQMVLHAA
jgi:PEP-CTERM motif